MTDNELLNFYHFDLRNKYKINNNEVNEKLLDEEYLKFYWMNFDRFLNLNGNKLNNLVIPKIHSLASFEKKLKTDFNELDFNNCHFLDDFYIIDFPIQSFTFSNCVFEKTLSFQSKDFNNIRINFCTIGGSFTMFNCSVNHLFVGRSKIFEGIMLKTLTLKTYFNISYTSINHPLTILSSLILSNCKARINNIYQINKKKLNFGDYLLIHKLKKEAESESSSFFTYLDEKHLIDFIKKRKEHLNISYLKDKISVLYNLKFESYKPTLTFQSLIIEKLLNLNNLDLSNFSFNDTNIENINFNNCDWKIEDRLLLLSEEIKSDDTAQKNYRQLKLIFNKEENWEMSGFAYVSEMEMKKRSLGYRIDNGKRYLSKDALEYLVYQFYSFFGGYTQNFIRPLSIFIISTFIIFPLIYLFSEPISAISFSLENSFQKSIANAFPIIKTDLKYQNWYLKSFQIFFSTILLTFIILGLRKRFKQ